MTRALKQIGMSRREFCNSAAAGLLVSVFDTRTMGGATADDTTFNSDGFSMTLHSPQGEPTQILSLRNPKTDFEWARAATPIEPVLTAAGQSIQGWTTRSSARGRTALGDRFEFTSQAKAGDVSAQISLQAFADLPIVEFQAEFKNGGKPNSAVTAFGPFRFALRDDLGPLQVHAVRRNKYGVESLPVDGKFEVSGGGWNAPEYGGLLVLEAVGREEFLVVGIEWERGWHYRIEKDTDGRWLSVEVADLTHDMAVGERLSAPRVFVGLAHGDREQAFLTARRYMQRHVFPVALKNWPWIAYDFWATEATGVEEALLREVEFSAKLGIDVFYMDASWYSGSSKKGTGDWGCGLGHYTDDRQKYPSGLAAISRRVHQAGMKFGLWVGPNIVDTRIVGTVVPKIWLAQVEGKDQTLQPEGWESSVSQVCLGCREYIDFLKKELTRVIRDFQLDWLKWDNSGIPGSPASGCNRADHGHQAGDASYAALVGEYEIFNHLHATFPDLVLEQCGYGSRLDYGLARSIRSNWLSDASFPSDAVRHNAIVASYLYPSAYNGAWIVVEDPDLVRSAADPTMLDTIFRSRMMSLFGFGTLNGQLKERVSLYPEPVLAAARRNIALYKRYRHLLQYDCYRLPPSAAEQGKYEAIQFVSPSGQEALVMVFRGESPEDTVRVPLDGLRSNGTYEVRFANNGSVTRVQGNDMSSKGIAVSLPAPHTSEIVLLQIVNNGVDKY